MHLYYTNTCSALQSLSFTHVFSRRTRHLQILDFSSVIVTILDVIRAHNDKNRYTVSKGSRGGIVLAEKDQISAFSREIIDFQRKNHLTDTEMALNSHVSVEHIHNIKSMREMPDSSVVATLKDYMEHKPSGK